MNAQIRLISLGFFISILFLFQNSSGQNKSVGVGIGNSFSKQNWNYENKFKSGYYGKVFLRLGFNQSNSLAFLFQVGIINKGTGFRLGVEPDNRGPWTSIDYYSFEWLLELSKTLNSIELFVQNGPRIDVQKNVRWSWWSYSSDDVRSPRNYNHLLVGYTFSTGARMKIRKVKLGFGIEYLNDLSRIVSKSKSMELEENLINVRTKSLVTKLTFSYILN